MRIFLIRLRRWRAIMFGQSGIDLLTDNLPYEIEKVVALTRENEIAAQQKEAA